MRPFVLILSFLFFTSCNDSSTEYKPVDKVTARQFISNDSSQNVVTVDTPKNAGTLLYVWLVDFDNKTKKKNPKFKNERFGLIMFGTDYAYISLEKKDDGIYIVYSENIKADKNNEDTEIATFQVKGNDFYLEVMMEKGGVCHFRFGDNEDRVTTVEKSFTAKPGRWVGAKIGMFCIRNNITNEDKT